MKTNRFFGILAVAAMLASSVACEKEPETTPKPTPEEKPELSTEAKLTALTLTAGDATFEGFVYETDKVVEITYLAEQLNLLKNATANVTVSAKATVSPDPTQARDYTVEGGVVYTVTAEDGTTKAEYKVELTEAVVEVRTTEVWKKTIATLGYAGHLQADCGIAFCGEGLFALSDGSVYDLEGTKVGNLNVEGVVNAGLEGFEFVCMTSDDNGNLVATVGYNAAGGCPVPGDGDDQIATSKVYAWVNGYDQKPYLVNEQPEGNNARYMSVAGDIKNGPSVLVLRSGSGNPTVNFHHFVTSTGMAEGYAGDWSFYTVTTNGQDGCWGTQVSPAAVNGAYFIWDSAPTGEDDNSTSYVYATDNTAAELTALSGTITDDEILDAQYAGWNGLQFGNYSVGHVRGFMYDGKAYVAASTSGWSQLYLTVVSADGEEYLLRTQAFDGGAAFGASAYWYDEATSTGYLVYLKQNDLVALYKIAKEII